MLRHSQQWWGLGYVPKPFPSAFERHLRVPRDPRIHFALNCGASSCPAIAFYSAEHLDQQLDAATDLYLSTEVDHDMITGTCKIPALFGWFKGDFGGTRGIRTFLAAHGPKGCDVAATFQYRPFNWTAQRPHFATSSAPFHP